MQSLPGSVNKDFCLDPVSEGFQAETDEIRFALLTEFYARFEENGLEVRGTELS